MKHKTRLAKKVKQYIQKIDYNTLEYLNYVKLLAREIRRYEMMYGHTIFQYNCYMDLLAKQKQLKGY